MKVVINCDYGGFSMSTQALAMFNKQTGSELKDYQIPRDHPVLIDIVEQLGDKASGRFSSLKILEIPDDVDWIIQEYDGAEWVAENHRTWK